MENKNLHLTLTSSENPTTIILREGEAEKIYPPKPLSVSGTADTPRAFLVKRLAELDQLKCHLVCNPVLGNITLHINERDAFADRIEGHVTIHPYIKTIGINTGHKYSTHELADFIKINRSLFSDKGHAMKLVTELRSFKAKVSKDVEKNDDQRGNTKLLREQSVASNIPEGFTLRIPMFIGSDPVEVGVEIQINPETFDCTLVSADVAENIQVGMDRIINQEIEQIKTLAPLLLIVQQ